MKIKFSDVLVYRLIQKQWVVGLKSAIENLLAMPIKKQQLNYDVTSRLKNAVNALTKDYEEQRVAMLAAHSKEKEVEFKSGKKLKTKFKLIEAAKDAEDYIVKVDGKKSPSKMAVKENHYDVIDIAALTAAHEELLNVEVEFNAYKLKLSRFEGEDLAWKDANGNVRSVSLGDLEIFIENDLELVEE
ncbi:hypothetical protein C4588_07565 [Candidatus Parcubacteria bacterium]|jgi:plasmid maintenance system killer protein|nr:MAG: hypothetical protein C4588_07565 [Candidatus Parcubacteria bacterium]